MNKSVLIIIDMINDFVFGELSCYKARKIIPNIKKLISWAHKSNIDVIYLNDAHNENDQEFKVYKKHAIINTYGSQIIDEIKPFENDIIFSKNNYNGFINTNLDAFLKQKQINKLYICGLYTNICVKELATTGFQLGYDINIFKDAVTTKYKIVQYKVLKELRKTYNAKILKTFKTKN